jgi:hypothetical protein
MKRNLKNCEEPVLLHCGVCRTRYSPLLTKISVDMHYTTIYRLPVNDRQFAIKYDKKYGRF